MSTPSPQRLSSGIPGLDEILHGGFLARRTYLVRGAPGTGKTMLGIHFLTADSPQRATETNAASEDALFISLSESVAMVREATATLNIDLNNVAFLDLTPKADLFSAEQTYDIFSPAEVERTPTTQTIVEEIEARQPQRVFIDAITQLRYLTNDDQAFRRYIFSLLRFLRESGATVLFTSESGGELYDDDLQFISDGIVTLEQNEKRRFISVQKMRGTDYHAGRHALRIKGDGLHVYPQLVPRRHSRDFIPEVIASGVTALDAMLHGGLERGTITLITGPLGVGKTTVGMHFMKEAAHHGERSVAYLFEEGLDTVVQRCESIGIPAKRMVAEQNLALIPVDPLALTAEEFAYHVRQEVEVRGARILMLDSVAGYQLSIRGGEDIPVLHALIRYLRNMGITIIVINEADMTSGFFSLDNLGFSYLADNVIFMRYIEKLGELQKTIGVLKKRASDFDKAMRELDITDEGIKLGPPVTNISDLVASAFVGSGHVTPIEEEEI